MFVVSLAHLRAAVSFTREIGGVLGMDVPFIVYSNRTVKGLDGSLVTAYRLYKRCRLVNVMGNGEEENTGKCS